MEENVVAFIRDMVARTLDTPEPADTAPPISTRNGTKALALVEYSGLVGGHEGREIYDGSEDLHHLSGRNNSKMEMSGW